MTETPVNDAKEKEATAGTLSLAEVNAKLDRLIAASGNTPATASKETSNASVEDQVNKAVSDAKAKDAEAQEKSHTESRIKKLEELAERPPAEVRKLTKLMWGNE